MMHRILIALAICAAALQSPSLALKAQAPQPPPTSPSRSRSTTSTSTWSSPTRRAISSPASRERISRSSKTASRRRSTRSPTSRFPLEQDNAFLLDGRPVSSDTQSNRQPFAGRLYVIVLDDQDVSLDAHVASEEIGQGVRRQVHGRERHRGRHPHQRPHRRRAGVHEQQAAAARRHRQVHRAPHALAHHRAARRVLPEPVDRLQNDQQDGEQSRRRRPIRADTAAWSRPTSSADSAPSACSTR